MEMKEHQYSVALARALLFKSTKDFKASEPEGLRRSAAYLIAEGILTSILEVPRTGVPT